MKSSVIEVRGLFSALCALGVEKRLRSLPGVQRAEVSYNSGSATVVYDETKTDLGAIKAQVRDCGYACTGELMPSHVCKPADQPGDTAVVVRAMPAERAARVPAAPTKPPDEHAAHAEHGDAMAHEMGHGAGMDMAEMVRDMRNRFLVCLAFTIPLFFWAPMGLPMPDAGTAVRA